MLVIQKAEYIDLDSLMELWYQLIEYHKEKTNHILITADWKDKKKEELTWIVQNTQSMILVARLCDSTVGYIRGSIRRMPALYDHVIEGHIEEIYVQENFRRTGIGVQLAKAARLFLASKGAHYIDIHVDPDNEQGQKFWETIGFETIAIQKRLHLS